MTRMIQLKKEGTYDEQDKNSGLHSLRGAYNDGGFHSLEVNAMGRDDRKIKLMGYTVAAGVLLLLLSANYIFS